MNVATHSSMVQYAYSDLLDCFKLHQIDSKCIKYITLFTSDKIAFKPRGQFLHLHKQTSKLQKKTYHGLPWLRTYRCQRLERKGKWSKGMRHYKTHSMAAGWGCKARRSQFFSVHSTHWCASAKVSVSEFYCKIFQGCECCNQPVLRICKAHFTRNCAITGAYLRFQTTAAN